MWRICRWILGFKAFIESEGGSFNVTKTTLSTNHKLKQDQVVSSAHAHSRVADWLIAVSYYVLIYVKYLKLSI